MLTSYYESVYNRMLQVPQTTLNRALIKNKDMSQKADILYVENDNDLLTLISLTLSDIANVKTANNLAKAKKIIEEFSFEVIILDYVFPEGTSDRLIPMIKNGINKTSKIIIFSAYEENIILEQYVNKILLKTNVTYEEFKKCVKTYIEAGRN